MRELFCPLCGGVSARYADDWRRAYLQCSACGLTFAEPASHLGPAEEKAVYDQHENNPSDARYRRFLSRLAGPLLVRLSPGMQGLDYGCGPGPALSVMLEEAGMEVALYDPYFAPFTGVLNASYDFVTCSEVAEHFYRPARDWARMAELLRPAGWLGVMTRRVQPGAPFDAWYYKNDPTHVSFYSDQTFAWLAARHGLRIDYQNQDTIIFRKR
jgi:hypothetical protein